MFTALRAGCAALAALALSGCLTTSMQGYADREIPAQPLQRLVVYVAAQGPLATSLQASVREEARKRGVVVDDALTLLPPTRTYTDAEVRRTLDANGIDGVLVVTVGDSGVIKEYAGTVFQAAYSGNSMASGTATNVGNVTNLSLIGTSSARMTGTATPIYRYNRQTNFSARLIEAKSGRNLWVGNGQVAAGGLLFVRNGTSADSAVAAIFNDLQSKRLIGGTS